MNRTCFLVLMLLSASAAAAAAAAQPSVLVTTQAPRSGSLPRTITAYGTVQPSPDQGSETLSLLRAGQVQRIMVTPGQTVRRGQQLLAVTADPQALATYRQAVAALAQARGDRARMARMLSLHLATRDQLAQADRAVADAQASLDALDRAGGGSAQQTLTAPFDGTVASITVTPGSRVAAQAPLVTVVRSGRLVAAVGVEPAQRGQVAAGQPARIEPLYGSGTAQGSVLSVGSMLDPQSRMVPMLVDPPPADLTTDGMIQGAPVRVVVQVGKMRGWLVPRAAVLTDAKGPYLFQVNAGHAARLEVRIIGTDGDTTVVAGPLDPAHALVTSGNYQLQDGEAVRDGNAKP